MGSQNKVKQRNYCVLQKGRTNHIIAMPFAMLGAMAIMRSKNHITTITTITTITIITNIM